MKGWVYIIREEEDGPFKVGWTAKNPRIRLAGLQVSNPRKLHLKHAYKGEMEDEFKVQDSLRDDLIRGEWYKPSETLEALAAGDDDLFEELCWRVDFRGYHGKYVDVEPECPSCESKDPRLCGVHGAPHESELPCCPDEFHKAAA